jgi:hypothetical protein
MKRKSQTHQPTINTNTNQRIQQKLTLIHAEQNQCAPAIRPKQTACSAGASTPRASPSSPYWESDRAKRGQFDELSEEKRRKEKKDAWIRELEVRDAEEDELRRIRDNLVRGRAAERVGLSEGAARKAEEEAMARKRDGGNGSGVLSVLEMGEGRGDGPVLAAVRGLWRR